MKKSFSKIFYLALLAISPVMVNAKIKLPVVFGDNMVLQQKSNVNIWGTADKGEVVQITTSWNNKTYTVKADSDTGKWKTKVATPAAGGPYTLSFKDEKNQKTELKNVLIGEVWFCSGQSNMQIMIGGASNPERELLDTKYDEIRVFTTNRSTSLVPVDDAAGQWKVSSPQTAKGFSAVAYFFARNLHKQLKVPVGIIHSAYGASPQEAWLSEENIKSVEYAENMLKSAREGTLNKNIAPQKVPTSLYHTMFKPLVPFTIKGVCWYQGEGNSFNPDQYELLLKNFISACRKEFENPQLPFIMAQLSGFLRPERYGWVRVQEIQYAVSKQLDNVATILTYDIGEPKDIHPKNKQDVGYRMFLAARKLAYNEKSLLADGPSLKNYKTDKGKVIISFDNYGKGLVCKDGCKEVNNFMVAGEDKVFYPAKAVIKGRETIEVQSPSVQLPLYVRYAFDNYNENVNLYNSEGLPAVPFRTDNFKLDYTRVKYSK